MDTGSLFASLGDQMPPPAQVPETAPQEQAASSTGNEQGSPQPMPSATPMGNIMAAVMRGAARVQGQEQAKAVLAKQAGNADKLKVTMEANPNDPGNPLLTIKNVTADKLNGTEASDVKQAYTQPSQQVEAKLAKTQPPSAAATTGAQPAAPTVQAPTTPPPADHPLEQAAAMVDQNLGYRMPRPWDPDIAEKLKSEAGIRQIAEEMGDKNPEAAAHQAWKQIQNGDISAAAVQQRVANFRLQKLETTASRIEQTMAPAQRAAAQAQAEADRQKNEARLLQSQKDAETKAQNEEKLNFLRNTDTSLLDSDPQKFLAQVHASTNAPWSASDDQRALLKQKQDINKAFLDYTDTKKDTFALGNQPTWEAAKAAFGHPLTPQQDTIGRARWQAAHTYAVKQQQNENIKQQHADDQHELAVLRLQNATKEKPVALARGDINLMDASELTSIDPSTVKNYDAALEAKQGFLQKEIADHTDKRDKAAAQAKAILAKDPQRRQYGDEEQLAGFQADQKSANARVLAAQAQLAQIQAARAARKTGGTVQPVAPVTAAPTNQPTNSAQPPAAPVVPPHKPVANGQYTPQVENGIAAYMHAHGIGRSKAIQALRAAGKIQ